MATLSNLAYLKPRVVELLRSFRPVLTPYAGAGLSENLAAPPSDSHAMSLSQFQAFLLESISSTNLNA
ncbi:hypothetical protein P0D75_06855 [Paraburkholderia sediminicola]|uniref:hypothetical protein n=1 Tax=Paraburkholderia sediminicola TaxID=458836 RepID=UPI0038B72174